MTGYLICYDGTKYQLPLPLSWQLDYALGVPCDSFWLRCVWEKGQEQVLADAVRFEAEENGETVFRGVVDECQVSRAGEGCLREVAGRGMAALLLDNEAGAADYQTATVEDILRDHVTPYGIETAGVDPLPAVSGFAVQSGSSEWKVLYDFARYYGGVAPRFDREGKLWLTGWQDGEAVVIGDSTPVTELVSRDRRYGVLSRVTVRDRTREVTETVENGEFLRRGGRSRRVLTMPGRSNYRAMRYSGQFQLDKSASELLRVQVRLPILFFAWPGQLVRLERWEWGRCGTFRVLESRVEADRSGGGTRLELGSPDAVI